MANTFDWIQERIEGTKRNSFGEASDSCTNGSEQSEIVLQLNELNSFGSDNIPKVPFFPIGGQSCSSL